MFTLANAQSAPYYSNVARDLPLQAETCVAVVVGAVAVAVAGAGQQCAAASAELQAMTQAVRLKAKQGRTDNGISDTKSDPLPSLSKKERTRMK